MMQYLLDLPIAVKVALAPVIVGLCLVVTSASAYLTNLSTAGALGQIVHDNMPRLEQTERLKDRLLTTYATLMQSVAYEGAELKPELIAAVDSRLKANFKALHDDLDRLRAAAASRPDMAKRLEQVDQGLQRLERVAMQAIDLKGVGLGAAAVSITSSDEAFQALRQHMDEVATLEAQASQAQGALAEEAVAFGNRISLGMTLIALLLSAAVTGCLVRLITSPLADAVKIAQEVASGNLAVQAQPVGRDATGQVLAALTEVSRRLSHTIAGIRASVDEIDNASREIAQGNLDLSTRTERSSMSLQQAASTIEQLSATMRSNADAARGAREQAAQALEVAREGGGVVQGVVQTMDVINDQARRIREIIGVIDGIAFQTNILALNAAVEAARAGEQGRGFAVVAQEVRSLAGRSAEAAKEIRTLIGASVGQIEAGHQQARSAGETMLRIVGSIEQVSRRAVDIAEASAEQAQGIAHVNQTVSEMDRSTQQNAALVEQAAAATASLKQQAEGLMRAVAVFRTAA